MGALFDVRPMTATGVFTSCIGDGCLRGVEFDGFGGVREPGWRWEDAGEDDEFEPGWACPECQIEITRLAIAAIPVTAWTFPA